MKQAILSILSFAMPAGKAEKRVLGGSFILYSLLSVFLVFTTNLIDDPDTPCNLYYGLDGHLFVNIFFTINSGWSLANVAHPFAPFILAPFSLIAEFLLLVVGFKVKTMFLVFLSTAFVSASLMMIYRYLYSFLGLDRLRAVALVLFTGFFSTTIVLSFTPESYPVSFYLLTYFFVYYSFLLREGKVLPLRELFILTFLTCGITITNGIKCFIPELFTSVAMKEKIRRVLKVSLVLAVVFVIYYALLSIAMSLVGRNAYLPWVDIIDSLFRYNSAETYPDVIHASWIEMALSHFLGSPLLFSESVCNAHPSGTLRLLTKTYPYIWQYVWACLLLFSFVFVWVRNYKNKYVLILLLSFAVDTCIHLVLHYGIYEAFIYGGHWVFLVPMLWGWLYKGQTNRYKIRLWDVFFVVMGLIMIINNMREIALLVEFGKEYYPAIH